MSDRRKIESEFEPLCLSWRGHLALLSITALAVALFLLGDLLRNWGKRPERISPFILSDPMTTLLAALAAAYVAFCIWLIVRIVNRRERWAKRTAVGLLIGLPLLYIGSFGPACWIAAAPRVAGSTDTPRIWLRFYFPIGAIVHRTQSQDSKPVKRWITWGAKKGERVIVPVDASGTSWYGFTAE
jgi:hypothetical protein